MASETLQQKLGDAWNEILAEHLGHPVADIWTELSDDELYALSYYLWSHHQDAVSEWSRRQMRKADPAR